MQSTPFTFKPLDAAQLDIKRLFMVWNQGKEGIFDCQAKLYVPENATFVIEYKGTDKTSEVSAREVLNEVDVFARMYERLDRMEHHIQAIQAQMLHLETLVEMLQSHLADLNDNLEELNLADGEMSDYY